MLSLWSAPGAEEAPMSCHIRTRNPRRAPSSSPANSASATVPWEWVVAAVSLLRGATPPGSEERRGGEEWRYWRDWSSDVCSSDLQAVGADEVAEDVVALERAGRGVGADVVPHPDAQPAQGAVELAGQLGLGDSAVGMGCGGGVFDPGAHPPGIGRASWWGRVEILA